MLMSLVTPAATGPVSLADAKAHCRVDYSDEDALISALLDAASVAVSEMSGRVLVAETWRMSVPGASGDLRLPKSPVQSLTAITYYDRDGVGQSANVNDFFLFADEDRAILRPKDGKAWPSVQSREDALSVDFVAGYADVPANLRQAVLLLVGHWYLHREAVGQDVAELPLSVEALVGISRRGWVAA